MRSAWRAAASGIASNFTLKQQERAAAKEQVVRAAAAAESVRLLRLQAEDPGADDKLADWRIRFVHARAYESASWPQRRCRLHVGEFPLAARALCFLHTMFLPATGSNMCALRWASRFEIFVLL